MKYFLSLFFLLGCLYSSGTGNFNRPLDSIGFKKIDGQYFILHKVDKGQGLFGVARRYNTTVDEITRINPEVKDGLKVGQVLKIPMATPPVEEPKKEEPKKETPAPEAPKKEDTRPNTTEGLEITHTVKGGETLFAIAKQYNTTVEEIKRLNKLTDNSLKAGQVLIIKAGKKEHTENYGGEDIKKDPGKKETKPAESKPLSYEYNSGTGEVKESGYCVVAVNEVINQERSYCLHPTAPIGTIIMVTNPQNNKSVFVRVVGRYESNDKEIVLKLSKASAERLSIGENDRVLVKLNYAK